jgi:hypothetical protein
MVGKTYQKMNFSKNGSNSYNFSVRNVPFGAYILKVKQGNNQTTSKLIVGDRVGR